MAANTNNEYFKRIRRRLGAGSFALFLALGGVSLTALPSAAQEPLDLPSQIFDPESVLENESEVQLALTELQNNTGAQLFVAYVPDFGSVSADEWVAQSAELSGMGHNDILLGVATDARRYSISVADSLEMSDSDIDRLLNAVESELSQDDWDGAAIAAAEALGGSSSSSSGIPLLPILAVGAGGIGAVAWIATRQRKKNAQAPLDPESLENLPTEDLDKRASAALVQMDDRIKVAEQDLGFADAQFAPAEIAPFKAALDQAKTASTQAFKIRQLLDDHVEETEPEARSMMTQIIGLASGAINGLAEQSSKFDELRNLQEHVDQVLADSSRDIDALESRIPGASAEVERLGLTYPPTSLASISQNPEHATRLLNNARTTLARGLEQIEAGDRASAVVSSRAVSAAVAQVSTLLDSVDEAGTILATAGEKLTTAIASIQSDIQDAQRLGANDPTITQALSAAVAAAAQGQQAQQGGDPIAALLELDRSETALDTVLEPLREQAEIDARAAQRLQEVYGRAQSLVKATNDYIEARKGAIGPEARTRLSEAIRHLNNAQQSAQQHPATALQQAEKSNLLAQEAQQLAQRDVQQHEMSTRQQSSGQPNLNGMILGGILMDQLSRGGFGGRGGFGTGGGFGSGGISGGGFGGSRGGRSSHGGRF